MLKEDKYAYILVTETGQVYLSVVMAEDNKHGEGLAHENIQDITNEQIFDTSTFPVNEELELGITLLKQNDTLSLDITSPKM